MSSKRAVSTPALSAAAPVVTPVANEALPGRERLAVWIVVLLSASLQVIAIWLGSAARRGAQPVVFQHPIDYLGGALITLGYGFVFVVLAVRMPHNRVGWVFGAVALISSISNAVWGSFSFATETIPPRLPFVGSIAWLGAVLVPVWAYLVILLALIFPDGRPLSPAWGRVARALAATTAVAIVGIALGSGSVPQFGVANPFALPAPVGDVLAFVGVVALFVSALTVVIPWCAIVPVCKSKSWAPRLMFCGFVSPASRPIPRRFWVASSPAKLW